jgi:hypothetical protein
MSDATCDGEEKVGWHLTCLILRRSRILQGCECECSGCSWISTFFVKGVNQQPGKENALQCKIEWAK